MKPRMATMARHGGLRGALPVATALLSAVLWLGGLPPGALATGTFFVDGAHPNCPTEGNGEEATPYCTIQAAVTAHHGPGDEIKVKPYTYRERVVISGSGDATSAFRVLAFGAGVVVDGADNFSTPGQWTQYQSSNTWLAAGVTWVPNQVFIDGVRLTATTGDPALMATNTYQYVVGTGLYVDVGGDNPGSHQTLVSRRTEVFYMSGKSYVTIEGFTVARANDKNIRVQTSNNITIKNNTVIQAYGYGIQFDNADASSISGNKVYGNRNHGIGLTAGSTGNVVELNESYDNTDGLPRDPGTLFANGLYLTGSQNNGSSGNEIRGNNFHHNKDTGGHIQGYSSNNIFLQNRSWSNGQHGFDHTSDSTGTIHVGDIAYGNAQDGFQIETRATGTKIYNSISVNNGTGHYNLEVRPDSISGFASDYNIWWRTDNLARIKWNGTTYNTVCNTEPPNDTFCEVSSGNDTHGTQADPKFFGPAWGDFFLLDATSPAVDSADSSVAQWPQTDAYGQAREDDPKPDTGFGPFPYAERGAVEFLANPTNLTTNGSFETDTSGWGPYGGSTIQRVSGGQSGSWGLEMQGTATLTTFGTNDSPNWVSSTPAAGRRYRFAAWVRSATNVGNAKLRVREYLNGQQQGTTTYSNEVVLSPTWQGLSVEYVAVAAGSTLDFQVLDYPQALSEVFQVDNIQIWLLP